FNRNCVRYDAAQNNPSLVLGAVSQHEKKTRGLGAHASAQDGISAGSFRYGSLSYRYSRSGSNRQNTRTESNRIAGERHSQKCVKQRASQSRDGNNAYFKTHFRRDKPP